MIIINSSDIKEEFYTFSDFENITSVTDIINDVKNSGDSAVIEYSQKFGDGQIDRIEVSEDEIQQALRLVPTEIIEELKTAVQNVEAFAKKQFECIKNLETTVNGASLGHKIIPLKIIGAYVPGGNYPLPSSAIMSVVPAKVAGVENVIVCSPRIKPVTIAACKIAGADKIYRVGGVQAIAAMAYGTESIPKVDKITGPGNKYVTASKKQVYGVCGIDFLAGPSEVMIIADESAKADFIAADMLAQCEHDLDARAYLITNSKKLAQEVQEKIKEFLNIIKTSEIASKSIEKSYIIEVDDINDAVEIANKKAPEHLEICLKDSAQIIDKITNYGSLFIGNYSAEVLGDYCSGTNHVLPTNGVARYNGGLSVFDFIKIQTYQEISKDGVSGIAATAAMLASVEGLDAHRLSAELRKCK